MPVTLGKRILRAETAGLVAASAILYELGGLGGRKATLGLPIDELIANGELTCGLLTKSLCDVAHSKKLRPRGTLQKLRYGLIQRHALKQHAVKRLRYGHLDA